MTFGEEACSATRELMRGAWRYATKSEEGVAVLYLHVNGAALDENANADDGIHLGGQRARCKRELKGAWAPLLRGGRSGGGGGEETACRMQSVLRTHGAKW